MPTIDRRDFLKTTGWLLASARFAGLRLAGAAPVPGLTAEAWIRNPRIVIAEGYNPPFYPACDYVAEKAVRIVGELNGDALRYPAAAYYAFFPTKSGYPVHPELKGDPMRETFALLQARGLKAVAYVPLNHPFMDVTAADPRYAGWSKKFADGRPMTTEHYGYATYFEGCLNSPVRDVIKAMVREVLAEYPTDVLFFDGPYQGMANAKNYCHCGYCEAAYRQKFGRPVPDQRQAVSRADEIQYTQWMANEVVIGFLAEVRDMIRQVRPVPVLFNDTSLLSRREWRNRAIPVADGFMFEAAETAEDKLFNLQLGHSTGRVTWTYVGTHTQYNREHLKDERVRGWFSYPVESEELLLDGATAIAGGAGLVYWGMARFFYEPREVAAYASGRHVKTVFDFLARHDALLRRVGPRPQVGILIGDQTIDWYGSSYFVGKAYENAFHGAFKLLKGNGYDAEPFLDWQMTAEGLARYPAIFAPNVVCLSNRQCRLLEDYVENGGYLIATHLTSAADEFGRPRPNFGLSRLLGVSLLKPEPTETPDLYLQLTSGEELPQDPQVVSFRADTAAIIGRTFDRGHRRDVGPAVVRRPAGKGAVIYIGSSLEAVYEETLMEPLRQFFGTLLGPWLEAHRTYAVEFRPGLLPHFCASGDQLLLHLLADTGNKEKHLRAREWFLPIPAVKVRIRIPGGRSVAAVRLLRAQVDVEPSVREGWLELTLAQVLIHEAVLVELR